jgi:predicted sulfurtransferase
MSSMSETESGKAREYCYECNNDIPYADIIYCFACGVNICPLCEEKHKQDELKKIRESKTISNNNNI